MILNASNLLFVSFIILIVFIYKTSAKNIILFIDNKIETIKYKFVDIEDMKKDAVLEVEHVHMDCANLEKEIKYLLNHCERELEDIIENLNSDIALYEKELQQKTNFTTSQKKALIIKEFREDAALKIQKHVLKHASKQNSLLDINSLITTLSNI